MIRRQELFFGTALLVIILAALFWWLVFFANPFMFRAHCRQTGPNEYLCEQPLSGPNPPGQLQP